MYLRMIIGPLGYETIQRNLECALPSLPSINRYLHKSSFHVTDCIPRYSELFLYLTERKNPLVVALSEDETKIVGRPQYDSKTYQIVGFVPPIDRKTGLPVPMAFPARSADEIISHFSNQNVSASYVNVVMAQPIGPDYFPPFCLLIFGSDSKYTRIDVENRWTKIIKQLNEYKIRVISVVSDSDTKYNSCIRNLSKLGCKSNLFDEICENMDWFKCETYLNV